MEDADEIHTWKAAWSPESGHGTHASAASTKAATPGNIMSTLEEMEAPSPKSSSRGRTASAAPYASQSSDAADAVPRLSRSEIIWAFNLWRGQSLEVAQCRLAAMCANASSTAKAFDRWALSLAIRLDARGHLNTEAGKEDSESKHVAIGPVDESSTAETMGLPSAMRQRRKTPNRRRPPTACEGIQTLRPQLSGIPAVRESANGSTSSLRRSRAVAAAPSYGWPIWSPALDGRHPAPVSPQAPSCMRRDRPPRFPRQSGGLAGNSCVLPERDASYQAWRQALRRNAAANNAARAKDWAARRQALKQMRLATPSRVVPWHVSDGSLSHVSLVAATADLCLRTQSTRTVPAGDERLGRTLAGWASFAPCRAHALSMADMDLALLN